MKAPKLGAGCFGMIFSSNFLSVPYVFLKGSNVPCYFTVFENGLDLSKIKAALL